MLLLLQPQLRRRHLSRIESPVIAEHHHSHALACPTAFGRADRGCFGVDGWLHAASTTVGGRRGSFWPPRVPLSRCEAADPAL